MIRRSEPAVWALFVLILIGCLYFLFTEQRKPLELTFADSEQPVFGLVYIAEDKGFFKKEGLSVTFKETSDYGKTAIEDLLNGTADLADTYETPVVQQISRGTPIDILTTLHYSMSNVSIAANAARGIRTPQDLVNKTVATVQGTHLEYLLLRTLAENGIDPKSVTIVYTTPSNLIPLLTSGAVDAATIEGASDARIGGNVAYVSFSSDIYAEMSLIVGMDSFIKNNPEKVSRFIKALADAEAFYQSNTGEAETIVENALPETERENARTLWSRITLALGLNNVLLETLNQEAELFRENGMIGSSTPRFTTRIQSKYLKKVLPLSVTIYSS